MTTNDQDPAGPTYQVPSADDARLGYRQLNAVELELLADCKRAERELGALYRRIMSLDDDSERRLAAEDPAFNWAEEGVSLNHADAFDARRHLRQGVSLLIRAFTRPYDPFEYVRDDE